MEDCFITPSGPLPPAPRTPACTLFTPLARNGRTPQSRIIPVTPEVIYRLNPVPLFPNVVSRRPQRLRAPPKRQEDFVSWSNVELESKYAEPSAASEVPRVVSSLDQPQPPSIECGHDEPEFIDLHPEPSNEPPSLGSAFTPLRSPIRSVAPFSPVPLSLDQPVPYSASHPLPVDGQRVRKPAKVAEMCCDNEESAVFPRGKILDSLPNLLICAQCEQELPQSSFSVSQLRKYRSRARCQECIGKPLADPRFPGLHEFIPKPLAEPPEPRSLLVDPSDPSAERPAPLHSDDPVVDSSVYRSGLASAPHFLQENWYLSPFLC